MGNDVNKAFLKWQEIEEDSLIIAKKIIDQNNTYKGIVVISRGGLGAGCLLSRILDITMIDVICINSYDSNGNSLQTLNVLKRPELAILDQGKGWLVVDDLIDSGDTYECVMSILPYANFACLYSKYEDFSIKHNVIYSRSFTKNTWVVFPWECVKL